jgi:hypothetical protein
MGMKNSPGTEEKGPKTPQQSRASHLWTNPEDKTTGIARRTLEDSHI